MNFKAEQFGRLIGNPSPRLNRRPLFLVNVENKHGVIAASTDKFMETHCTPDKNDKGRLNVGISQGKQTLNLVACQEVTFRSTRTGS